MSLSLVSIGLLAILVAAVLAWAHKRQAYFEDRGIFFIRPTILVGNTMPFLLGFQQIGELMADLYNQAKGHDYFGYFQGVRPMVMVRNPELVERVLVKEFSSFADRGLECDEEREPLEGNLFLLSGAKWRRLRAALAPTFTSGRLKWMFNGMADCTRGLLDQARLAQGGQVEARAFYERFTTAVIGSCAFGYDPDSTDWSLFLAMGRRIFEPTVKEALETALRLLWPAAHRALRIPPVPLDVSNFFHQVMKETLRQRRTSGKTRNDFVQLLLQLKDKGYLEVDRRDPVEWEEDELGGKPPTENKKIDLTDEVLTAQAFIFFEAGQETSSTSMAFTSYLLAKHPQEQSAARDEVRRVKESHGGQITYDAIKEMEHLGNCIKESLRLYPPVSIHFRVTTRAMELPDGQVLEKGLQVVVPVLALHMDPELWSDPGSFRPDRFSEAGGREGSRPGIYVPFGDGPRICIGKRFAEIEMKLGLATLLDNYRFELSPKTEEPLQMKPRGFISQVKNGIWIRLVPLDKCVIVGDDK